MLALILSILGSGVASIVFVNVLLYAVDELTGGTRRGPHEDYIGGRFVRDGRPVAERHIFLKSKHGRGRHRFCVVRGTNHVLEEWNGGSGWRPVTHSLSIHGHRGETPLREALRRDAPEMMEHLRKGGHVAVFPDVGKADYYAEANDEAFFDVDLF